MTSAAPRRIASERCARSRAPRDPARIPSMAARDRCSSYGGMPVPSAVTLPRSAGLPSFRPGALRAGRKPSQSHDVAGPAFGWPELLSSGDASKVATVRCPRFWRRSMGMFSKDIKSLEDLYKHGLQDLYYAENQILKALPKLIDNAADARLRQGLQQHLRETENQVKRLEQVFELHGEDASGTKCPAIDGIIKEGDDLMGEVEGEEVMGVGIIAAAQAVEHYEITRYGALIAWAKELGHRQDAAILARNLEEEKAADRKLTVLAERRVNPSAEEKTSRSGPRKSSTAPRSQSTSKSTRSGRRAAASRRKPPKKQQSRKGRRG